MLYWYMQYYYNFALVHFLRVVLQVKFRNESSVDNVILIL